MLGLGWVTLKQAQEALENGRLEEAHRFLNQPEASGYKGASQLLKQLAQAFVKRAEQRIKHDDLEAAWKDLSQAERLGNAESETLRLRQHLTRLVLAEARTFLEAGDPNRAVEILGRIHPGQNQSSEIQVLEEAAKGWTLAKDLAGRGEFSLAQETANRVRSFLPRGPSALIRFCEDLAHKREAFAQNIVKLHEAVEKEKWREVISLAEVVLALAPQHPEARKARALAWKAIEPAVEPKAEKAANLPLLSPRFVLWVDGVGGFLICLGNRVTLGQATPEANVDVPLFADISRTHAALTRDVEGYVLEAIRSVQVNGKMTDKALLQPGDRITMGTSCQMVFRQPVPVSATARLDLTSGHRLALAVEAVLLMADTLVLGPSTQSHVTIPDLPKPVILYRSKEGIGVRYTGNLVIDGQSCKERGILKPSSRVQGEDFTFAIETLGGKLGGA